jgi:hypothetical protein
LHPYQGLAFLLLPLPTLAQIVRVNISDWEYFCGASQLLHKNEDLYLDVLVKIFQIILPAKPWCRPLKWQAQLFSVVVRSCIWA